MGRSGKKMRRNGKTKRQVITKVLGGDGVINN
jgi:hypothetical protein